MLDLLKEEMERKMIYVTSRLDTTNDNAKWYSTFAMAECTGIVAIILSQQSYILKFSLAVLVLSLISFILSVYRSQLIRRALTGESSKIIISLLELKARGETLPDKDAQAILEKWRNEYTNGRWWDTEVFNTVGLFCFGVGTLIAGIGILNLGQ